jgi:lipid A ethanolaminephosphotransferase
MGAKVQFPGQFLRHAASDALIEPLVEPDSEPGVRWRPLVSTEMLIVLASLYFALFCNGRFWNVLVVGRAWASVSTWVFAGAMLVVLVGIHCLLLALVVTRWNARLVLVVTLIVTALVRYYMERYTVFFTKRAN